MLSKFRNTVKSGWLLAIALTMFSITGCCSPDEPSAASKGISKDQDKDYLPFKLQFKLDGTPELVTNDGEIVSSRIVDYPLKTEEIYRIQTVTLAFVKGSCTVVVPMSNKQAAVYTYPDKLCKLLGIPLD